MRRVVVGECDQDRVLQLSDPDAPSEVEFEHWVVRTLTCFFPGYHCIVFGGSFRLENKVFRPDLALIARDFSHWFVIEVELVSHSFARHVLPQVRALRYGTPLDDVCEILSRELNIMHARAMTLIDLVPRSVVVIANRRNTDWEAELRAHDIPLLTVSTFLAPSGLQAFELEGDLLPPIESLGFGIYSATDRSMRFPSAVRLPEGRVQIYDLDGAPGLWSVSRSGAYAWITKENGTPSIPQHSHLQLLRTTDGRVTLRRPSS